MIKDERVLELIEIIKKKKRIAVKELAEITFSSTSTLRRDLIFLENQGLIKRKHGYVTLSSMNTIELSHQIREGESTRQKRLIASLAKDFIRSGMCIYLDSSTTTYELCPYLSELDNLISLKMVFIIFVSVSIEENRPSLLSVISCCFS